MSGGEASGSDFGALLRLRRSAAGLTQEELSELSGLSTRAIADMERGRTGRPYRSSVLRLAGALALPGPEREQLVQAARPGAGQAAMTSGWPASGQAKPPVSAPRQLPPAVPHFTGRVDELKALTGLLDGTTGAAGTVVISAIAGPAGIGKTSLAVHWAHQVADRFPDGQLYVNLRGFGPSGEPVSAAEVLREFLDTLGVPSGQIPATTEARTGLYRSLLASRSMLILLDNARDAAQVRPLLPGAPACMVVVTSRSRLAGLIAADGGIPLFLDVLTQADARELLARRLGSVHLDSEPAAAEELIGLCARLPLALAIVAARAALSSPLVLHELARDLRAAASRLDVMDTGEAVTSVRAVFSWSYQMLTGPAARMFRLLGVHPGPDITAAAAASLAGVPAGQSHAQLSELAGCHLVTEHPAGRFTFHDLLRAYAAELAGHLDSDAGRRAAIHRGLDHYLHTARSAALVLLPRADLVAPAPPQPAVRPEDISGYGPAMAWFEAEHRVLLSAITQAASAGFDPHAGQLPSAIAPFLTRRGYWDDYAATQRIALAASLRLADLPGQARAHLGLGQASTLLGSFAEAHAHYGQAVELRRQAGDRRGHANACIGLAFVFEQQGRYAESLAQCAQALELYQAVGDRTRQAITLNNIGWCHAQTGNYQQALAFCQQAIALHEELGDAHGEAATSAWDSLGYAYYQLADFAESARCHLTAARLFGDFGDRHGQAMALAHLGDAQLAAGHPEIAGDAWQQALAIFDDLDRPDDVEPVRVKLRQLRARG
jgi:tetratricopeptide (TPR) repeat protein